ncbi:MAG: hypothetical protein WBF42_12395 [Terracidiphilus sp.]
MMHSALPHLAESPSKHVFPVPTRCKNIEALVEAQGNPGGTVLCSVHLPLVKLLLRHMVDSGIPPTAVVADRSLIHDGRIGVWGSEQSLPGLIADKNVLFRTRHVLKTGGLIATLVDVDLGNPVNCNLFRFIRSTGARMVFFTTALQPDGAVMVEFFAPPDPFCLSDESVLANLQSLQNRVIEILQLPSSPPVITLMPMDKRVPRAQVAYLELDS